MADREDVRDERLPTSEEPRTFDRVSLHPALIRPPESAAAVPGSGLAHAQTAAMVDRLVRSLRVGTVNGDPVVHLDLSQRDVKVELRRDGEAVHAVLRGDAPELDSLAERIREEMSDRDIDATLELAPE